VDRTVSPDSHNIVRTALGVNGGRQSRTGNFTIVDLHRRSVVGQYNAFGQHRWMRSGDDGYQTFGAVVGDGEAFEALALANEAWRFGIGISDQRPKRSPVSIASGPYGSIRYSPEDALPAVSLRQKAAR